MEKLYQIYWSKTYYASGIKNIKANSGKEAVNKIDTVIGNLTGSMMYCPENNLIEIVSAAPINSTEE